MVSILHGLLKEGLVAFDCCWSFFERTTMLIPFAGHWGGCGELRGEPKQLMGERHDGDRRLSPRCLHSETCWQVLSGSVVI